MEQDFSRQKTYILSIFLDKHQTQFKSVDFFFPWPIFPPKDLVFFFTLFVLFAICPLKSANL